VPSGQHSGVTAMTDALAPCSAFQRDILWTLAHEGASKGTAIQAALAAYYEEDVNHGRLYTNLDALVDAGLITKSARDRRTNEYALTELARDALAARQRWQASEAVSL